MKIMNEKQIRIFVFVILIMSIFCAPPKKKFYAISYGKNGGTKNVDSLVDAIYDSSRTDSSKINFAKAGSLKGNRPRKQIMITMLKNLSGIRYAYNRRLREKPKLKGKLKMKFKIISEGTVIYTDIFESTLNDSLLHEDLKKEVEKIVFPPFSDRFDTTEVVFPFNFSR